MTTSAVAAPALLRFLRDALLPALAGVIAPHVVALGWGLVASAIWGPGLRLVAFVDPTAARPVGYGAASLLFAAMAGALIGAGLALARARRAATAPWALWVAFAVGALLSVAHAETRALVQLVVLLFIVSSALGFRLGVSR